jgi:small subunit ribosomal protein S10
MTQKIRIKLRSYDHNARGQERREDREDGKEHGRRGKRSYSLANAQAHLHRAAFPAREQEGARAIPALQLQALMDIYSSSSKTIDALMKLELPSGVDVEIKV